MDSNTLVQTIEAILFFRAEPMTVQELSELVGVPTELTAKALEELEQALAGRGIRLVRHDNAVTLATAPDAADVIERIRRETLMRNLGKAALETLSIVLYRGPITRSEIDYIRGVNSTFTLRGLLMRDLIERVPNPKDQRGYLYKPTLTLLGHLGVSSVEALPNFSETKRELDAFEERERKREQEEDNKYA